MHECFVSFSSASEVMAFVSIATKQFFPIHVEQGDLTTSATSIMSIFSMGLNRPLRVLVADAAEGAARFLSQVQPYLVPCSAV